MPEERATQFGPTSHLVYHQDSIVDETPPQGWRLLVRKPIVRQWTYRGKLYREAEERVPSRFELFLDLIYVSIIHQLADAASEEPTGASVARFVLTFFPSWSIWLDARNFFNVSGQDDVFQRVWMLVCILCLAGYSVNASAIGTSSSEAVNATAAFLQRAVDTPEGATAEQSANFVRAAVAFFLVSKATRVVGLLAYAYSLPKFRKSHLSMAAQTFLCSVIYLPLIWVTSTKGRIVLGTLGIALDYLTKYTIGIVIFESRRQLKKERMRVDSIDTETRRPKGLKGASITVHIPAINIEHSVERTSAFTIITFGEMLVGALYKSSATEIGLHQKFGRMALILIVAFSLNWLYFAPTDAVNSYEHALRRNWFTASTFTALHWPLCASIILASSAASRMVNNDTVVDGLMWYWGAGIGMALVCMVGLDLCHRDMNKWNSTKLPRPFRVTGTFLCSLIFILIPLASSHLTTLSILSISAGILIFIVCFDFYGRTFTISTRKKMMSTDCELRRRRVREEGVGVVEKEEEEGDGEGGKRGREDEMQFAELGGHM